MSNANKMNLIHDVDSLGESSIGGYSIESLLLDDEVASGETVLASLLSEVLNDQTSSCVDAVAVGGAFREVRVSSISDLFVSSRMRQNIA